MHLPKFGKKAMNQNFFLESESAGNMVHQIYGRNDQFRWGNLENVYARKKHGFGTVKDIMNMLDSMCLGPYMFKKATM